MRTASWTIQEFAFIQSLSFGSMLGPASHREDHDAPQPRDQHDEDDEASGTRE